MRFAEVRTTSPRLAEGLEGFLRKDFSRGPRRFCKVELDYFGAYEVR